MNISTTKALIPVRRFIPVPKATKLDAISYDLYPKQYRGQVVFEICIPDESDGKYGPDGKILTNPKFSENIDIYV